MELSQGAKAAACVLVLGLLVIDASQVSAVQRNKCALRVVDKTNQKAVCVCNATYCDNLVFKWPQNPGEAYLVESSRTGSRLDVSKLVNADWDWCGKVDNKLVVDLDREHQSILGFGGAFTDAGGINVMGLPEVLRNKLVETYYGEHGSQYNFGRVTISGIDCSTHPYSYDDLPKGEKDYNLTKWSLAPEDLKYKIPLIKQALEMVKTYNSSLKLFGSSWSPPAWMKDNESLVRGHLIDSDQIYESYAQYLVKFYNAYKSHGIEFWGGTLQNEPIAALSPGYNFNSLELRDADAVRLIRHLGPALAANGYTKDKFKLMVGDDNLGSINDQVRYIMSQKEVYPYVAGLAFHWYRNLEPNIYQKLTEIYDQIKDHIEFALMTEACIEPGREVPVDLGSWPRGERYANDIIEELLRQSGGWIEWNMALDEQGGPNWVRNFLDAAIVVSNNKTEFYKQPMYYALAHFSRFFRPGSVRVDVNMDVISPSEDNKELANKDVSAVAVHKKDTGHVVVNILNKSDEPKMLIVKTLDVGRAVRIQGKSINTVVIKL
ncbi:glucosylceramidase isoform X2 [Olea europaea subsp. europaea]|uniref:Glucosylceramidase isoform X2 n=1 Tax=Olea europaea subsp. europaea TaxID=158383 RepID=A0A8S0US37_OLEEU|nr:glucosylceramidase isoform X2 [Olea europaea subsp. europaea]